MLFRSVIAALAAGTAMFVASVGMHLSIFGWHAYRWMYDEVPGFDRLRSPFRFSVGVQLAIIVLVALAAAAVVRWRHPAGLFLTLGFALLVALETVPFGAALERVPATTQFDWVQYLEGAPAGVVAMVPFPDSGYGAAFRSTTVAMLAALHHGHPIVNGYTGFFPDQFDRPASDGGLWYAMDDFPDRCGAEQLQRRNVQYLVVERAWYSQARAQRLLELGYRMVFNGRNDVVLRDSMEYRYQHECA